MNKRLAYLYSDLCDSIDGGEAVNCVRLIDKHTLSDVVAGLDKFKRIIDITDMDSDVEEALREAINNDGNTSKGNIINRGLEDISIISTAESNGIEAQLIIDKSSKCNTLRIISGYNILDFSLGYSDYIAKSHKKYPREIYKACNKDLLHIESVGECFQILNLFIIPRVHTSEIVIPASAKYVVLLEKALCSVENLVLHSGIRNIFICHNSLTRNSIKNLFISYDTDLTLINDFLNSIAEGKHFADRPYEFDSQLDILDKLCSVGVTVTYV